MIQPSEIFDEQIQKILGTQNNNHFRIEMTLRSKVDAEFSIDIAMITEFEIEQDFIHNTTDNTTLVFKTELSDLIKINQNLTGLYVTILIEYVIDVEYIPDLFQEPDIREYSVLVINSTDISKYINTEKVLPKEGEESSQEQSVDLFDVQLSLLSHEAYNLRTNYINGLFTNCTVDSLIKYATKTYSIPKLNAKPPDNTTQYLNCYIHPKYGSFDTLFEYLQNRYGIYQKGLVYYFHEDTLHILPRYDLDSSRQHNLTVLNPSLNNFVGSINTHTHEGNTLKLVTTMEIEYLALSDNFTENEGNTSYITKADNMIDNTLTQSGGKFSIQDTGVVVDNPNSTPSKEEAIVFKYNDPTTNICKTLSDIASREVDLIRVLWVPARPNIIRPDTRVKFVFDRESFVEVTTGTVLRCIYTYTRLADSPVTGLGYWSAELILQVSPHTTVEE